MEQKEPQVKTLTPEQTSLHLEVAKIRDSGVLKQFELPLYKYGEITNKLSALYIEGLPKIELKGGKTEEQMLDQSELHAINKIATSPEYGMEYISTIVLNPEINDPTHIWNPTQEAIALTTATSTQVRVLENLLDGLDKSNLTEEAKKDSKILAQERLDVCRNIYQQLTKGTSINIDVTEPENQS